MRTKVEMLGKRFGKLVVIEESMQRENREIGWVCKCDCGNITKPIRWCSLRNGKTRSCGCLVKETAYKQQTKHGESRTRLYRIRGAMIQRCSNPKHNKYKYYGGRGITVCDEWKNSFEAFHDWAMANGYQEDLTIDRIDVNGNYEPANCRWATMREQRANQRKNTESEI